MSRRLTAIIQREDDSFVALCPEVDIASQGDTIEAAQENLREALELFFECAPAEEIEQRLGDDVFVTHVEVAIGETASVVRPRGEVCAILERFPPGAPARRSHRRATRNR